LLPLIGSLGGAGLIGLGICFLDVLGDVFLFVLGELFIVLVPHCCKFLLAHDGIRNFLRIVAFHLLGDELQEWSLQLVPEYLKQLIDGFLYGFLAEFDGFDDGFIAIDHDGDAVLNGEFPQRHFLSFEVVPPQQQLDLGVRWVNGLPNLFPKTGETTVLRQSHCDGFWCIGFGTGIVYIKLYVLYISLLFLTLLKHPIYYLKTLHTDLQTVLNLLLRHVCYNFVNIVSE
jgi:hypothetical protein